MIATATTPSREKPGTILAMASAAFVAGAYAKIVGFDLPTTRLATSMEVVEGSSLPLLLFGLSTIALFAARIAVRGPALPAIPVTFVALVLWCVVSLSWSPVPQIGGMRLAQAVAIPVFALLAIDTLGVERTVRLLAYVLLAALALDYLYVAILPGAKHLSNEIDAGLVGNWRGVHTHKNVAGGVLSVSILVFLRMWFAERRRAWLLATAAAGWFLLHTSSKTSIAILVVVLAAGVLPRIVRGGASSAVAAVGAVTIGAIVTAFAVQGSDHIWAYATDRESFTGRGALWAVMTTYAKANPWLGEGFGSFWRVGPSGPSFALATGWDAMSYNGHNGYMDMMVTTGAPGLILTVVALVLAPLRRTVVAVARRRPEAVLCSAVVLFCILHNFFETTFVYGSSQLWLAYSIALMALVSATREVSP